MILRKLALSIFRTMLVRSFLTPSTLVPMQNADIPILLVDDDIELATMLGEYLSAEGFVPTAVHSGESGVIAALSGRYAAVVLDIMLPGIGGIEALRQIRQQSSLPVIMLTAKGDDIDRVIGLEMGADDYVPKPCFPRELVARLRAVLRRTRDPHNPMPPPTPAPVLDPHAMLRFGMITIQPASRRAFCGNLPLDLTASEFSLLEALMLRPGSVVSKDELSVRVLGRKRESYDRSIDVHMSNLRQKLTIALGQPPTIETVRGIGYLLHMEP
jgi:two-component system OmpR family response regulator